MALIATSRLALERDIGDALDIHETGIATGGAVNTVVCATYPFKTNRANASTRAYEGCEISVMLRANVDTHYEREITAYAPSTGTFTVSTDFSGAINTDYEFDIWKRGVKRADVHAALLRALRKRKCVVQVSLTPSGVVNNVLLPDWVESEGAVIGCYYNLNTGNITDTDMLYPVPYWEIVPQQDDTSNLFELRYAPASDKVITLKAYKPYHTYAAATDDKNSTAYTIMREWAVLAGQVELLDTLRQRTPGQETNAWQRMYMDKVKRLALLDKRYGQKPVLRTGFSQPPNTPAWRFK